MSRINDSDPAKGALRAASAPMDDRPRTPFTAIILPASPASFIRVAGLPLVARQVLAAQRAGAAQVLAVGGTETQRLRAVLDRDERTAAVPVAESVAAAARRADEGGDPGRLIVVPPDCLLTPRTLEDILASDDPSPRRFRSPASDNGYGILAGSHERVLPLLGEEGGQAPEAAELRDGLCLRVRDAAGAAEAERRLLAELRAATAETDGPIARFDRAVSTRISRLLVRTPVRPNHLTVVGTTLGLLAAWPFGSGTYGGGIAGALLFCAAVIIDGCDGEVARLKFLESRFGYLFDVTTDNVVHAAVFVGIGVGQYRAAPDQSYVLLSVLLVTGFLCATAATYFCLIGQPPVRHLQPASTRGKVRRWFLRGFEALMNRDFAYLLLVLAVLGRLHWFLWGAALGTYVYAVGLVLVYRLRESGPGDW